MSKNTVSRLKTRIYNAIFKLVHKVPIITYSLEIKRIKVKYPQWLIHRDKTLNAPIIKPMEETNNYLEGKEVSCKI